MLSNPAYHPLLGMWLILTEGKNIPVWTAQYFLTILDRYPRSAQLARKYGIDFLTQELLAQSKNQQACINIIADFFNLEPVELSSKFLTTYQAEIVKEALLEKDNRLLIPDLVKYVCEYAETPKTKFIDNLYGGHTYFLLRSPLEAQHSSSQSTSLEKNPVPYLARLFAILLLTTLCCESHDFHSCNS